MRTHRLEFLMSRHYGKSVSILQIFCLSLLSIVKALKLLNPSTTFPGDSLDISWDASPDDPKNFDLEVGFCDQGGPLLFEQAAISTQSSSSRRGTIKQPLPSGLEPPVSCSVRAFDSDTGTLLDSSPVELLAASGSLNVQTTEKPIVTVTTRPPQTHTSPTTSSPDIITVTKQTSTSSSSSSTKRSSSSSPTKPSFSSSSEVLSTSRLTTSLSTSLTSSLQPVSPLPTTSETALSATSTTSGSTTTTTSTSPATKISSASSDNAKRSVGPLLWEVLGVVFAFLLLLSIAIIFFIWRRRRRQRAEKIPNPFVPEEGYLQPISKREEIENERSVDVSGAGVQSNQELVPGAAEKADLARSYLGLDPETRTGTRTGAGAGTGTAPVTATVEEEVTMLRERLMALEDQHRELTGELRIHAVNDIPPEYSR